MRHIFSQQFQNEDTKLIKQIKEYMNLTEIALRDLKEMKYADIKTMVNEWDTKTWKEEAAKKSSLSLYVKYKSEIKQERWFDNSDESKLMYRARTDTLDLNDKNKHKGKDTTCLACGLENESLEHFLLHCNHYEQIRRDYFFLFRPYREDTEWTMADILLFTLDHTNEMESSYLKDRKEFVKRMWKERSQLKRIQIQHNSQPASNRTKASIKHN